MVSHQCLQCRGVRGRGGLEVLAWGHVVSRPGMRVQVPGATQLQYAALHPGLVFWVGGFILLPMVPFPCPLFSLSQNSFEAKHVQKLTASHLFPSKRWQLAVHAANHTLCHDFTGLGKSAAAVAGVKTQVQLSAVVVQEQIQLPNPCRISFLIDAFDRLKAQCRLLLSTATTNDTSFSLSSPVWYRYRHIKTKLLLWD